MHQGLSAKGSVRSESPAIPCSPKRIGSPSWHSLEFIASTLFESSYKGYLRLQSVLQSFLSSAVDLCSAELQMLVLMAGSIGCCSQVNSPSGLCMPSLSSPSCTPSPRGSWAATDGCPPLSSSGASCWPSSSLSCGSKSSSSQRQQGTTDSAVQVEGACIHL